MPKSVNIRPQVTVLSVLSHLEYRPWHALAEYVDNAIQSFQENRDRIRAVSPGANLVVEIEVDPAIQRITVKDNAAGIAGDDFPRAFRPAEIPPDTSGLSEFGMGMKSASCWFAPLWRVRTTALGEAVVRTVEFDIDRIVYDKIEELVIKEDAVDADSHFTVLELDQVRSIPVKRTSGKIKEHLADIYREFLRQGEITLVYRGEELKYDEPATLVAPRFTTANDPEGDPVVWRRSIDFDFGEGLTVKGFAALRETGNTRLAGFSLFRRGRVIEGSGDEKYRPSHVFGSPNSFMSQRLFGELHLSGFEVSHTKDGFRWNEDDEEAFLELLRDQIDAPPLPLIQQARNYRERSGSPRNRRAAESAVGNTAETLEKHARVDLEELSQSSAPSTPSVPLALDQSEELASRSFTVHVDGIEWMVEIGLSTDPAIQDWLSLAEEVDSGSRRIAVRLGLESPFMRRIVRLDDRAQLEPVVRLAAGIALAEHIARAGGAAYSGHLRRTLNRLLARSLSMKPNEKESDEDDQVES